MFSTNVEEFRRKILIRKCSKFCKILQEIKDCLLPGISKTLELIREKVFFKILERG